MAIEFKITKSKVIQGVYIIEPSISTDLRGNIWSSFQKKNIEKLLPANLEFIHDKFSQSEQNVLRGIHGDNKSWKLVTCVWGDILQVIVDCRVDSLTYLKHEKFRINKEQQKMILIPPNVGNSYYVYSEQAVYHYKLAYQGEYIDADDQFSIKWDDARIGIDWPSTNPILSNRDSFINEENNDNDKK